MSDEYLTRITNYIFDFRYTRALLIDGDWGCGKSYFVKNTLIKEIEATEVPEKADDKKAKRDKKSEKEPKKYKVIMVSLYGISKVDDIQNSILAAVMEKNADVISDDNLKSVVTFLAGLGGTAIKGVGSFFGVKEDVEEIGSKVGSKMLEVNKDNIVLIFDDVERCQVDIIELMGYLNNLCENNGYRVILIANEKEIAKQENEIVKAIQSHAALVDLKGLNENVSDDSQEKHKEGPDDALKTRLEDHRAQLFNRNTIYERTREKLIGLTVRFQSRIVDVYDNVLKETIDEGKVKDYLQSKKELIIEAFEAQNHENLRTLISLFIAVEAVLNAIEAGEEAIIQNLIGDAAELDTDDEFEEISVEELLSGDLADGEALGYTVSENEDSEEECIDEDVYEEDDSCISMDTIVEEEKDRLLQYMIYTAISRAKGLDHGKLGRTSRYGFISFGMPNSDKEFIRYAFIDEYWDTLVADPIVAHEDFYGRISECVKKEQYRKHNEDHIDLALFRLQGWYRYSDEAVFDDLKKMKDELRKGYYYPLEFKDIIVTIMNINDNDYGMDFVEGATKGAGVLYDALDDISLKTSDEDSDRDEQNDKHSVNESEKSEEDGSDFILWEKTDISEYVKLMMKQIKSGKYDLKKDNFRIQSGNKDFAAEYRRNIQPILDWIDEKELAKLKKSEDGLNVSHIESDKLCEFINSNREVYISRGQFLSLYGYAAIKRRIKRSSTDDLYNIRDAIRIIYRQIDLHETFSNDYDIVYKLWSELGKDRASGRKTFNADKSRTKEIALRSLESDLESYERSLRDFDKIRLKSL